MSSGIKNKQLAGERGELYVFSELLKRGIVSYLPLVDEGIDALVRTSNGQLIELQIKAAGSAGGEYPRWFQMPFFEPRSNFMIVCVEFGNGEPRHTWVFPSAIYDKYASRPPKGTPRDLDLDSGVRKYGMPLRDLLSGFRDQWNLIEDFSRFEPMMESLEDLEDLLTMEEAQDSAKDEMLSLSEYERRRSSSISG